MPKRTTHALAPPPRSSNGAPPDSALNLFGASELRPQLAAVSGDEYFLPDLCQPKSVLAVVLVAELLAIVLALAGARSAPFLPELARISLFVQWLALTSAAVLCYTRAALRRLSVPWASVAVFGLLLANAAVLTWVAHWVLSRFEVGGLGTAQALTAFWSFLLRNEGICVIVTAMLLRYFFVTHQWQKHVRTEARARIEALQARIRPHFLFNSLNTIAALTRSDPAARRGSRRGLGRSIPRHVARFVWSVAAERRARAHPYLSAHRGSCGSVRDSRVDVGRWPSYRCAPSCQDSPCSRYSRTPSITASRRSSTAVP